MLTGRWISIRFDRRSCFRPGFWLPGRGTSGTFRRCRTGWRAGADYESNAEILRAATVGKAIKTSVDFDIDFISWSSTWSSGREHETRDGDRPSPSISRAHRRPQRLLGMSPPINTAEGSQASKQSNQDKKRPIHRAYCRKHRTDRNS